MLLRSIRLKIPPRLPPSPFHSSRLAQSSSRCLRRPTPLYRPLLEGRALNLRAFSSAVPTEPRTESIISPKDAGNLLEEMDWKPPPTCPGCGAPSQRIDETLPGYYGPKPRTRLALADAGVKVSSTKARHEDEIWEQALSRAETDSKLLEELGVVESNQTTDTPEQDVEELTESLGDVRGTEGELAASEALADGSTNSAKEHALEDAKELGGEEKAPALLETLPNLSSKHDPTPLCSRCHGLLHHNKAPPLPAYNNLDTMTALLATSPHERNYIYHLVDAADLPLSLEPNLRRHLLATLPKKISRGLVFKYIITRADILFPHRQQISSLKYWFRNTLKDALPEGSKVLGEQDPKTQILAVSSRMGWNVGIVKKLIKQNRGATWFFGGVNVGKSSLLRDVWPDSGQLVNPVTLEDAAQFNILPDESTQTNKEILAEELEDRESESDFEGIKQNDGREHFDKILSKDEELKEELKEESEGSDLSEKKDMRKIIDNILSKDEKAKIPAPQVTPHVAPTVSKFPGTTAAPIRVAFKAYRRPEAKMKRDPVRGEIIDLPGVERWVGFGETGLAKYVREDERKELILQKRPLPQQFLIKPGQSMLLGGLYMITPKTTTETVIVNPFLTLPVHVCATEKAVVYLSCLDPANTLTLPPKLWQKPPSEILGFSPEESPNNEQNLPPNSSTEDAEATYTPRTETPSPSLPPYMNSAGTYTIKDDVTTRRNPFLHNGRPEALRLLPYKVLSTDIVLAGLGWIELTAQVRNRRDTGYTPVDVEVFSPEGKGVGQRTCLEAYMKLQEGARNAGVLKKKSRPGRTPMKGRKKMEKAKARGLYEGRV